MIVVNYIFQNFGSITSCGRNKGFVTAKKRFPRFPRVRFSRAAFRAGKAGSVNMVATLVWRNRIKH